MVGTESTFWTCECKRYTKITSFSCWQPAQRREYCEEMCQWVPQVCRFQSRFHSWRCPKIYALIFAQGQRLANCRRGVREHSDAISGRSQCSWPGLYVSEILCYHMSKGIFSMTALAFRILSNEPYLYMKRPATVSRTVCVFPERLNAFRSDDTLYRTPVLDFSPCTLARL